jgi:hypothetical protein
MYEGENERNGIMKTRPLDRIATWRWHLIEIVRAADWVCLALAECTKFQP